MPKKIKKTQVSVKAKEIRKPAMEDFVKKVIKRAVTQVLHGCRKLVS